jgi:pimeloyl-ACP methyl ester carboxylesterase
MPHTSIRFAAALLCATLTALSAAAPLAADGPADNKKAEVRRIPKLGVELPAETKAELEAGLKELDAALEPLLKSKDAKVRDLLPDVQIYRVAVDTALRYQEFFDLKETKSALELLAEGKQRAADLAAGKAPWTTQTGLVVRGYVSKIDGSVQPYGLVIPADYSPGPYRYRLDFWFHGRGENLSEVNFLNDRRKNPGTFRPEDTIVLHPYGRYSNANKFAGETDVFEALESVKKRYKIEETQITVRGFSMGGASTWHLAVHQPTMWAAANPGAGFSETPDFLATFQNEKIEPTRYQEKLLRLYDCPDWAVNLFHCPTIAYSGENDKQKQAADVMATAMALEGLELTHIIGPKTGHAYEPKAREEVERRMTDILRAAKDDRPLSGAFVTYTLKYNLLGQFTIDALERHWEPAQLEWEDYTISTSNITAFTMEFPAGTLLSSPFDAPIELEIDGQVIVGPELPSDRSYKMQAHKVGDEWKAGPAPVEGLAKKHGLQGPIDDAFMDSFIFVRPSGKCRNEAIDAWSKSELERAIEHWRRHFRGQARVKLDKDITEADIAGANLILWGDDQANSVWAKIADKLPLKYSGDSLIVGDGKGVPAFPRTFEAAHHAPIQIHPNPLNPSRYVVTNSSFTFREYAYLNNARQVPMLPDWAVVDLREKPDAINPGKIAEADFFGEKWEVRPPDEPPAAPAKTASR